MSKFEKRAKCPKCLPDIAGAYFTATYGPKTAYGTLDLWKCNNCGHTMPRRVNKPTEKITPSQQRILDKLTALGWNLTHKFIGRKVWVEGKCDTCWLFGDTFFGTVGPRGDVKLTRSIPLIKTEPITGHLDIYMNIVPKKA